MGNNKQLKKNRMKLKMIMAGLLVAALSGMSALACVIQVRIACPNDSAASGVLVSVSGVGNATTDNLGIASFDVPGFGTYTIQVWTGTLPAGATLKFDTKTINVQNDAPPVVEFEINGTFCETPPPPGDCWLTGGGTIGKISRGVANYSFGGVVYPGCSPKAADGGNWNVINHATGLHFQGQKIIVDDCSGVETKSPRVNVNIIDFHGTGVISGIGGNPLVKMEVSFVGRAVDNKESGGGSDMLYLKVTPIGGGSTLLQVGNTAVDPAIISDGNLQIHTTSCNK